MEYIMFIVPLLAVIIIYLWGRNGRSANAAPRRSSATKARGDEAYGRLLSQVLGDRQKAERLIKYAKSKNPGFTKEQCIEVASRSLESDIRRWD